MRKKGDYILEENNKENEIEVENEHTSENKIKKMIFDWVIPIAVACAIALLVNKFVVFKAQIPSASMVPTLNVGDQLFASRVYNLEKLKRGDIIVFNFEPKNELFIKRLIGLPGDTVTIKEGKVWVNGEELQEDYVKNPEKTDGVYNVPEGKYFFLGDNRSNSDDARRWQTEYGITYIDGKQIKGKAQLKVYPFSDFGTIK